MDENGLNIFSNRNYGIYLCSEEMNFV